MSSHVTAQGAVHLKMRSRLARALSEQPPFRRLHIVDDSPFDADVLAGRLRKIVGQATRIDIARNLNMLRVLSPDQSPDLVFLDGELDLSGPASTNLSMIRRLGYSGPIAVMSREMPHELRAGLLRLGAIDALHWDDLVTDTLIVLLLRCVVGRVASAGLA